MTSEKSLLLVHGDADLRRPYAGSVAVYDQAPSPIARSSASGSFQSAMYFSASSAALRDEIAAKGVSDIGCLR